jgi:putative NADH-flavin reductase
MKVAIVGASGAVGQVKQNKKQQITVTIPQNGGLVIVNQ